MSKVTLFLSAGHGGKENGYHNSSSQNYRLVFLYHN